MNRLLIIRIVIGLMLGILASSNINAQNQISDAELIALAKKKTSINSKEFAEFYEKFIDKTKKLYVKDRTQWYIDNKDMLKTSQGKNFNEKEWNPKKYAERDLQNDKSLYSFEKQKAIQLTPENLASLIREILDRTITESDPRNAEFRKQLKQWLEKHN